MATLTTPAILPALKHDRSTRWPQVLRPAVVVYLLAVGVTALSLRAWGIHATLESSDQAALGHMLYYSFGIEWIFAHDYGPVLPFIEAVWCRLLSRLHVPIDESVLRIPILLMSLVQVAVTWPLMRRLGFSIRSACAGCVAVAILPPLVSDAHYLWAYQTTWLLLGSVALWAALAWMDERQPWQLWLAAIALFLHCLSSLYSYALPIALLAAWRWHANTARPPLQDRPRVLTVPPDASSTSCLPLGKAFLIGCVLPVLAAVAVIVGSWLWTGRGQLGRLLLKSENGAAGLHVEQILQLPWIWCSQLGPVFGAVCAWAVLTRLRKLRTRDHRSLLALWAVVSIVPYCLLADWSRIGHAPHYTFEAIFAAALLGAAWLAEAMTAGMHWRAVAVPMAIACGMQLAVAGLDLGRPDIDLRAWTGIRAAWGEVRPDTGVKAAGYYIRRFVPRDATILSLHAQSGMELPVAEYYCGRKVLAHYDLPDQVLPEVWKTMEPRVDVVLVEVAQARLLAGSHLRCVCSLRRDGRIVRMVFARPELRLPARDSEIGVLNAAYDRECVPHRVPVALWAPPGFLGHLQAYQTAIAAGRVGHRNVQALSAR